MTEQARAPEQGGLERLRTGVPGLDEVLNGGLIRGSSYVVVGQPGTGKTVLGNHVAYNHAQAGGRVLFATTLAETHGLMLAHLSTFQFFAAELVAQRVHYVNVYTELSKHGLDAILDLLRRLVRERRATLLVIDGAGVFGDFARTGIEYRHFVYELHAQLATLGCTTLMLVEDTGDVNQPFMAIVDGVLSLESQEYGLRDLRLLHVLKLRGSNYLRGRHPFSITSRGIDVYPRLEAALPARPAPSGSGGVTPGPTPIGAAASVLPRVSTGIAGLDDMLRGGILAGTSSLVLGPPGAGKTVVGLHFIVEGARHGDHGLIATFHETPERLIQNAEDLGLELGKHVREGRVRIIWEPPLELLLDGFAHRLLAETDGHGARRLFLDAITDLERLALIPQRFPPYLAALSNALRERTVTAFLSAEANVVVGALTEVPVLAPLAAIENVFLLRYVELRSHLHRLISIVKARAIQYDTSIREFLITDQGIQVASTFESAEEVLTGITRTSPPYRSSPAGQGSGPEGALPPTPQVERQGEGGV